MKNNTKTAKHLKHPTVCADCSDEAVVQEQVKQTANDFRNALLIGSLAVNFFILTGWLILEVTSAYNSQIISYLQR